MGEDHRELDLSEERKSISSETTFLEDTAHRPTLRAALRELAADVALTLEKHGTGALTVQVKVRYSDFKTLTRQVRLEEPLAGAGARFTASPVICSRAIDWCIVRCVCSG